MYHTGISAGAIIVVLILIALIIALVVTNIRIVPQANAYVLERLGAYSVSYTHLDVYKRQLIFLVPVLVLAHQHADAQDRAAVCPFYLLIQRQKCTAFALCSLFRDLPYGSPEIPRYKNNILTHRYHLSDQCRRMPHESLHTDG